MWLFRHKVLQGSLPPNRPKLNNLPYILGCSLSLPEGVFVFSSLEVALEHAWDRQSSGLVGAVFVIGGAALYDLSIIHPRCESVYLTMITSPQFEVDTWLSESFAEALGLSTTSPNHLATATNPRIAARAAGSAPYELIQASDTRQFTPSASSSALTSTPKTITYKFLIYKRKAVNGQVV